MSFAHLYLISALTQTRKQRKLGLMLAVIFQPRGDIVSISCTANKTPLALQLTIILIAIGCYYAETKRIAVAVTSTRYKSKNMSFI